MRIVCVWHKQAKAQLNGAQVEQGETRHGEASCCKKRNDTNANASEMTMATPTEAKQTRRNDTDNKSKGGKRQTTKPTDRQASKRTKERKAERAGVTIIGDERTRVWARRQARRHRHR